MKIGFIGLGQMGKAIAANVLKAGHELTVWNRSADKADPLTAAGARLARRPVDAAQGDVVMTMLADDAALERVVFGDGGIAGAPALHVSHSTISIALADRLSAESSSGFVSAPVFGRPPAAQAAKLFVVAAGATADLDRCDPLFDAIGQRTFRLGDKASAANLVKLSGNFMIMAAVEAMAEAMTLAEKGGIDRAVLLEVLTGTLFDSPVYRNYGRMLVDDEFRPAGFAAPLGLKDMTLTDAAATALQAPTPILGIVRDHLRSAIATEGEDVDWASVALAVRRAAGVGGRGKSHSDQGSRQRDPFLAIRWPFPASQPPHLFTSGLRPLQGFHPGASRRVSKRRHAYSEPRGSRRCPSASTRRRLGAFRCPGPTRSWQSPPMVVDPARRCRRLAAWRLSGRLHSSDRSNVVSVRDACSPCG